MYQLLAGTIIISVLHALIPSHWLPLVSLAKAQKWNEKETIRISMYLAFSHVFSTILLGLLIGSLLAGFQQAFEHGLHFIGPLVLVISGLYFMYRHHTHHHFHIDDHMMDPTRTRKQIIYALMAFMFLSPCLEIVAYFINAGLHGWTFLLACVAIYVGLTLAGTFIWVRMAYRGLGRINTHAWEHNAGMITGVTMVLTGVLSWFMH